MVSDALCINNLDASTLFELHHCIHLILSCVGNVFKVDFYAWYLIRNFIVKNIVGLSTRIVFNRNILDN